MSSVLLWLWGLWTTLVLMTGEPAYGNSTRRHPTAASPPDAMTEPIRSGSPEMGMLIIIGAVGLVIFLAWILSRAPDDSRSSGDSSLA